MLNWMGNLAPYIMSFVLQVLIMGGISILLFSKWKKQPIKQTLADFSFQKIGFKAILISVFIGVIVYVLNIFVSGIFQMILRTLGYEGAGAATPLAPISFGMLLLMVLFGAVLPGVFEEISHRGLLLKGFETLGVKKVIIISGLLFGFMHFDINKLGYAAVIGSFLAYVTLLSRSIYPAMIIHFMNNFLASYLKFSLSNDLPAGRMANQFFESLGSADFFSAFIGIFMLLLGLVLLLLVLIAALFKQTSLRQLAVATEELAKQQIRKEFLLETGIETSVHEEQAEQTIAMEKEVVVGGKVKSILIKIPVRLLGIKIHAHHKWQTDEKVLFAACIFLGVITTVMSFVSGVI